ncbi:MAG: phosphatase PAP2 family protein [bacterium]|nr:phosphatase PAP2 family protein [bacterium]
MVKITALFIFLSCTVIPATAGTGLGSFWDEVGYVYSEGLYDETNLYTAAGFGAVWAGTFPNDERLLSPIGGEGATARDTAEILNYPGKLPYVIGASALTWGVGYLAGWDEVAGTGRDVTAALLMGGLTVTALKATVGRARPRMRTGAYDFDVFTTDDDWQSLPSGDAAVAFAWASVLTERTKSWPIAIGSYALATAASWSRVNKRAHWPSDLCLGALIGILYGRACGKYGAIERDDRRDTIDIGMYVDPVRGFAGVQLSW